jgi:hypothetical protein
VLFQVIFNVGDALCSERLEIRGGPGKILLPEDNGGVLKEVCILLFTLEEFLLCLNVQTYIRLE